MKHKNSKLKKADIILKTPNTLFLPQSDGWNISGGSLFFQTHKMYNAVVLEPHGVLRKELEKPVSHVPTIYVHIEHTQ